MTNLKDSLEKINNRIDQSEEGISEIKYNSFKIIQSEEQREKKMKKNEESLRDLSDIIKQTNIHIVVPE